MKKTVFATIIIPTYNQADFLAEALESLLAQTDSDWEAVVVNDGSTDNTEEIAECYARRDARIRCIHKANGGVASALNTGLAAARGEWIHWLSSDDMFEPEKLAINRRWIERYPETRFFFSYFTLLREATGTREKRDLWGPLPDPDHQLLTLFYRNFVSGISICVSRQAWVETGFFDESLRYAQDYDQWLRLLQQHQGRFIPEWTVISRNHAAQGSETFPDACYFDTAKAAIRFINQHSFKELVPWLNFNDREAVRNAVTAALDVASDRTSFLYCLGVHPALMLRVIEWTFSDECRDPELRALVQRRVGDNAFNDGDDDWSWMWGQLAATIHPGVAAPFHYRPTNPVWLAIREYRQRKLQGGEAHVPLRDYLIRFDNITPDDPGSSGARGPRIALLLDHHRSLERFVGALDCLAHRGARILCLFRSDDSTNAPWQQHPWGDVVRVEAFDQDCLPWLGEVDLAVGVPGVKIPVWLAASSYLELEESDAAKRFELYALEAFWGPQSRLRPVVFLERVLWGGGAERVVMDLAKHLDRKRYRPIILTMFDEHTEPPVVPAHIETYNVRRFTSGGNSSPPSVLAASPFPLSARHRLISGMQRIYAGVMPSEVRARIKLGQRLINLRHGFRTGVSLVWRRPKRQESAKVLGSIGSQAEDRFALDYVSAAAHHTPNAEGLIKTLETIAPGALVISVMEEAAATTWLAQAGAKFPYVVSLHTFESLCMADIFRVPARRRAESRLLAAACGEAAAVTFPSQGCCDDMSQNFQLSSSRLKKIWNPVCCAAIRRRSFQQDDRASNWRRHASGFRLVHVGRLDPQKNHDLLLAACLELKRRQRSFSLAIVGDGYDRPRVEQLVASLGLAHDVTFVGEQKNPFPWVAAADALLLTSRFEAFSLVLIEAMVCGTPVVSVDCPAGPGEVLARGEYGLLVPNNDPAEFANAVERLMINPSLAQHLSAVGYQRAEVFDIRNIVPQWQSLIDAVPTGGIDQLTQRSAGCTI